jgi:outer membrane protein OmpA-like peptidoglycan-associated protein
MTVNLLDMIKQALPSNLPDLAGKAVGESPGVTQTALSAALPALLAAVAQKGSTTDGAQSVLAMLNNPSVNTGILDNLPGMLSGGGQQATSLMNSGAGLLTSLLGDKFGSLASSLASVAGLRSTQSASNLLGLLAPIVLGFLKKFVGDKGLGASGLASLLGGQGQFLQGALDNRLTGALGFASPSAMLGALSGKAAAAVGTAGAAVGAAGSAIRSAGAEAASTAHRAGAYASDVAADATVASRGWTRWLPWIIAAIVLLFLLSRLSTCSQPAEKAAVAPPATTTTPPAATAPAPATTMAPAGTSSMAAATGGLPAKIYFDVGKSALNDDAKKAISAAADAAKQASAKVELTGYTDKTGDAAQNEELAKNRATAVRDALVAAGLADSSIAMKPPAFVTGSANDAEARRVEITKAP